MITVHPETIEDHAAVYEIDRLAFGSEGEPRLVQGIQGTVKYPPEFDEAT